MRGYYVVYLFATDLSRVYLSMNQGTTVVRKEFRRRPRDEMNRRAQLMRSRVPEHTEAFGEITINLGSNLMRPRDYEAAHAFGKSYILNALPKEETLVGELRAITTLYLQLTARGGLSTFED